MSNQPHLLVEIVGHVAVVTMNRPEARNAMDLEMLARLADAWDMIDGDDQIRCSVLTGAGGHFSSGSDLKQMHNPPDDDWRARFKADPDLQWKSLLRHYRLNKPLIAAVEGYAIAGGTEILQATDIRVVAETATFGVSEARLGLFPMGGSTVRLPRQIPHVRALEMLLTGRRVSAQEAEAWGLINKLVPEGKALEEAMKIADAMAANGPFAVRKILESVRKTEGLSEADGLNVELELGWQVFNSDDAKEGPRAFAEKREPRFTGK